MIRFLDSIEVCGGVKMERRFLWIRHLAIAVKIKKERLLAENNKDRNGTYGIHVMCLEFMKP